MRLFRRGRLDIVRQPSLYKKTSGGQKDPGTVQKWDGVTYKALKNPSPVSSNTRHDVPQLVLQLAQLQRIRNLVGFQTCREPGQSLEATYKNTALTARNVLLVGENQ